MNKIVAKDVFVYYSYSENKLLNDLECFLGIVTNMNNLRKTVKISFK